MKTTWRLIGLCTVMAMVLTVAPAVAATDSDTPKSTELADINARLDRIVAALQKLEGLKKDIKDVREDINYEKTVKIPSLEQDIRDLQQQVVRLTEDVARLRTSSTSARTAYFAGPGPGPAVASGTILLRNTYLEPVTIAINNRTYDVLPGAERTLLNHPAGEFTYEVLGIQPPVRRTLVANRTYSIEVFPR